MPALLSQETQMYSLDAASPLRYTWIQSQIHPYSAQPRAGAEMGKEWVLQGHQVWLCLHRNQPMSLKDQLSTFLKRVFVWGKRGVKELFWKWPMQTQTRQCARGEGGHGPNKPHLLLGPSQAEHPIEQAAKSKTKMVTKLKKKHLYAYYPFHSLAFPFRGVKSMSITPGWDRLCAMSTPCAPHGENAAQALADRGTADLQPRQKSHTSNCEDRKRGKSWTDCPVFQNVWSCAV